MFPKSLSWINKSMKTILQQLSFKALGTCWWQWDFFFPATAFSPGYFRRCHLPQRNGQILPQVLRSISSPERIPGIWVTRICHFLIPAGTELPALAGAMWATTDVTVTNIRHSRWRSVLPTDVWAQLLSTPTNHHLVSQQKNPVFTGLQNSCVLIKMCGLTWAEQNNMKYIIICAVKQGIPHPWATTAE